MYIDLVIFIFGYSFEYFLFLFSEYVREVYCGIYFVVNFKMLVCIIIRFIVICIVCCMYRNLRVI